MFLIIINDIFYVWTINYDTLYTSCIDKISLFNIYKDNFVYTTRRKIVYTLYSFFSSLYVI